MSPRETAVREREEYDAYSEKKYREIGVYFRMVRGLPYWEVRNRATALGLDDPRVWEILERVPSGAFEGSILRPARQRAGLFRKAYRHLSDTERESLLASILAVYAEYNGAGTIGVTTRQGRRSRRRVPKDWSPIGGGESQSLLDRTVNDALKVYLDVELPVGSDHNEARARANLIVGDALRDVRRLVNDSRKNVLLVDRPRLIVACRVLQIDPPRNGGRPDMKLAKKRKDAMVMAYHPDRRSGDASTAHLMTEAVAAYELVVSYDAALGRANAIKDSG